MRRAVPAIVVALGLAAPAAASAQSAGDNQYVDPFANSQAPAKHQGQQAQGQGQGQGGSTSAAAPVNTVQPAAASGTTASSSQLPRTGQPMTPLFALGGALLLAGLVLRLSIAPRRTRRDGDPQYIDLRRNP